MERTRFSGTLSIINQINQFLRAVKFWCLVALAVGLTCSALTAFNLAADMNQANPGSVKFCLRYETWQLVQSLGLSANWMKPKALADSEELQAADALQYLGGLISETRHTFIKVPLYGVAGGLMALIIGLYVSRRERLLQTSDIFKRGAVCFSPGELSAQLKKTFGKGVIRIGQVLLPSRLENLNIFLLGRPQQGKTQIILRILDIIYKRGDRALIWCAKKDDFITTHYREGDDYIFCPSDSRSVRWSLKNDVATLADFDDIMSRVVPENSNDRGPWNNGARELGTGLMRYWWLSTDRSNRELKRIFHSSILEMYQMLSETPGCGRAAGMLENWNSGPAYSFYITLCVYTKPFDLLALNDGDFSIRKYLADGTGRIYIPCGGRLKAQLQPVQSLFIDLFMIHHLDLAQDRTRRIWYLLDELPALNNKLPRLELLLNTGASYGSACVIGTQSFALLDSIYEENGRRAIFNACCTMTVFSIGDDKTAEELSKNLGTEEINKAKQNYSIAVNDGKDSTSSMQDDKERVLYMPDEIKNLKPMHFIVRVLGFGISETSVPLKIWEPKNPDYIADYRYSLEQYEIEYQELQERLAHDRKVKGGYGLDVESSEVKSQMAGEVKKEVLLESDNSQEMQSLIDNDDVF